MSGRIDKLVVNGRRDADASLHRLSSNSLSRLPFAVRLSLEPVIEQWRASARSEHPVSIRVMPDIEAYLERHPELATPIDDVSSLAGHASFVKLVLGGLFPDAFGETEPAAALVPFEYRSIYATPAFARLFSHESGTLSGRVDLDLRTLTYGKAVTAYLHILRTVYNVEIDFDYPVTFVTQDADTGLDRYFKISTDLRFVRIQHAEALPSLDDATIRQLLAGVADLSEWRRLIPPTDFSFEGLAIVRAADVTDERMIAMLERDLVEEESIVNRTVLPDVEEHVRTLLRIPHVELGLAAIDGEEFFLLNEPSQPIVDTFFTASTRYNIGAIEGSVFERCLEDGSIHVIEDLQAGAERSVIEDDLLRWGVRNVIAAPLYANTDRVGVLYLWSPRPSSLHALNVIKLLELLPIFSAAVHRSREEMRNRVRNVIMGQYTAIHPSVEWRFRQAALAFIQKEERGGPMEIEPIAFESVYPLFAATDIRASSEHRNEAVQHDLIDHLDMARDVLSRVQGGSAMLHHMRARTDRYRKALETGLVSSDEAAVRDFIQSDLDPVLVNLEDDDPEGIVERYRRAADPERGTLYARSRAFERSVERINQTISEFLDAEQARLQPLFPHYFEKHQTDGLDFTIYAGESLLKDLPFDEEHVSILRLWQLTALCGIAARTEALRDELDVPLETTHLILVQNTPISIRYRFDETRFDVDGPHHVRFEIMKQRVEKAHVKTTSERLTQPDRIAIVYSQDREIREYRAYVEYLQERGIVARDVETVDLDDLQGMKGLRALRVRVATETLEDPPELDPDTLARIARSVST